MTVPPCRQSWMGSQPCVPRTVNAAFVSESFRRRRGVFLWWTLVCWDVSVRIQHHSPWPLCHFL